MGQLGWVLSVMECRVGFSSVRLGCGGLVGVRKDMGS